MLHAAVADGLIAANPARGAKRPRVDRQPVVPFTDGEIEALRAAAPDWFAVALTVGLGAGLRQSEATGLTLDRIDLLRRELTVDCQLTGVSPRSVSASTPRR
jgi:integrase